MTRAGELSSHLRTKSDIEGNFFQFLSFLKWVLTVRRNIWVPCNFGALIKKLMCSKNIIWTLEVLYFWHWNYSTAVL
jgi:hypothetical protein